jgi:hypothetical protein
MSRIDVIIWISLLIQKNFKILPGRPYQTETESAKQN